MNMRVMILVLTTAISGACCSARVQPGPDEETVPLKSRAVSHASYSRATHTLSLVFPNGAVYAYAPVPERLYTELRGTTQPGVYFHTHIRNQYPTTLVAPGLTHYEPAIAPELNP